MSDKPLFDVETKIRDWFTSSKKAQSGMPAREEGTLGLRLQRVPLTVREEGIGVYAEQWKSRILKSRR